MTRSIVRVLVIALAACSASRVGPQQGSETACRCTPDKPCWPAREDWLRFGASLHGKLEQPLSPIAACRSDFAAEACAAVIRNIKNPFYLQDQSGGTQSAGWLGAWDAATSAYAVVSDDAADIQAALNFARQHRLRLVVSGTGHDYHGRSTAQ